MILGVNLTKFEQIKFFNQFYMEGKIDFVEILLDNFIDMDPGYVASLINNIPVSFHIMNSRYLEREEDELQYLANRVIAFSKVFEPIYISDHLFKNKVNNVYYPMQIECDYEHEVEIITSKIKNWVALLKSEIYIENFPSIFDSGKNQIMFFEEIIKNKNINALFDFSNAVISSLNNNVDFEAWKTIIESTSHFHVSGYRRIYGANSILFDTHDRRISTLSKSLIKRFKKHLNSCESTLVIEYDNNVNYNEWIKDVEALRKIIS